MMWEKTQTDRFGFSERNGTEPWFVVADGERLHFIRASSVFCVGRRPPKINRNLNRNT